MKNDCCSECTDFAFGEDTACRNKSCTCHTPQPTPSTDWEVTLADEGTPLARFQKERTDAMSEMFDNKFADGIYPTSKLFARLDDCVRQLLTDTRTEAYEKGQDDAFAGRIKNLKTLEIKETVNVPEALQEHFRQEGRTDERRRILKEVVGLQKNRQGSGDDMYWWIKYSDAVALLTKDHN